MTDSARGFGIDIGGSGIKGSVVDLDEGRFAGERLRIPTPQPSTPKAVAEVCAQIVKEQGWEGPVGCTFPAVVVHGTVRTAANVDESWIGSNLEVIVGERLRERVIGVNDADAAGLAEARFGAAKDRGGVVLVATLGTGIGTALVHDGVLVPNTELGHLELDGHDAETRASDAARDRDNLSWEQWAKRLQKYFTHVEALFWPDLIVVGGGVSKKYAKFLPHLKLRTEIVPASLLNDAGIIGAALLAVEAKSPSAP
jgi:polyphosphate glucokinase